ncbi:UDP-N-acetylmuramoyl-tripeptide--D-alanyl-D-alanine ligase [Bacillus sp. SM2101]|uniref:UDP-N-acetylmuramoyl-tripeptide--D-alanyl-D- alanine ligase n=1 Tax=Bacillus sp. SM2101 TaxID=2805366 RepID=UPI001BDF3F74|nr:UDP-N-acetylmuramoyl-tripeptide--D-alanyl-D-alanine ligase [Bacillus sp. SM2101]
MIRRTLQEIVEMVLGEAVQFQHNGQFIEGVSINSREIQHGNLFIPIIGERFNGHDFVNDAFEQGAVASLWQKGQPNMPKGRPLIVVDDTLMALQKLAAQYRQQLNVKVIGITGSNGKTTTKDLISEVLSTNYKVLKTEGNFNNHYGLPLTLLRLEEDTDIAVLEMGMSGRGEIQLLSEIARPNAAVITNIGESHLQDLGSREAICEAKLEIIAGLQPGAPLVYNGDEPLLLERVSNLDGELISFGKNERNNFKVTSISQQSDQTLFSINQSHSISYILPVLGEHNVYNALAAIATARYFHVSWDKIKEGLEKVKLTNMRMERIVAPSGLTIINDAYNASPTSMKAAIHLLNELPNFSRKFVVFGDMLELGENEIEFHRSIGKMLLPAKVDYVFTLGRLGAEIAHEAQKVFPAERTRIYSDKKELIREVKEIIQANDVMLVKASRGMELEEVVEALKW